MSLISLKVIKLHHFLSDFNLIEKVSKKLVRIDCFGPTESKMKLLFHFWVF